MQTHREILTALRTHYSEGELALVLGRLLRVPEAWRALSNPVFLEEVVSSQPPVHLTPSHLAALALGGELTERIEVGLLQPHAQRAERLWQRALSDSGEDRDLFETALIGLTLAHQLSENPAMLEQLLPDVDRWRSPLCVAWPALDRAEAVLADLLHAGAHRLAAQIVLSNLPADEAASYLARNANGSTVALLLEISRAGETALIDTMSLPKAVSTSHRDGLTPLLLQAIGHSAAGEAESASSILGQAWESASQTTAHVADFTADIARALGDLVTEVEANQRALETVPTPSRRARTAHSLAKHDRVADALALLSNSADSIEEQIALGCIQADNGQPEQAASTLKRAASDLAQVRQSLDHDWLAVMTGGLRRCGELEGAIRVAQEQVAAFPANASARNQLAVLLAEAGAWDDSASEAELAVSLAPQADDYRQTLARAYEKLGAFAQALNQRQLQAAPDPKALSFDAIQVGEFELAGSVVEQMLTDDPASVEAHIVLGRILAAKGETASANAAFQEAIRLGPESVEARLALASWQQSSGDLESAGQNLMQACQLDPSNGQVHGKLAEWMVAMGRESEAAEAAAKAVELNPDQVDYKLEHAKLLVDLGHLDQALSELQSAARQAPRDWRIGIAIAEAYEKSGDPRWAAQQLPQLPATAGPKDWLTVGRIGIQAALDLGGALEALDQAEQLGCSDPSLHFWYARGLEQEEQYQGASERYAKAISSIEPGSVELREQSTLGQARCELRRGHISAALAVLDDARQTFGGGSRVLALTSQVYRSAKLLDKAVEVAQQAVDVDPSDPTGWEALSEALAGSADFEAAFSAAERHSSLSPDSVRPWIQIGQLAADGGETALARKALAQAAWRARGDPTNLVRVASALSDLGHSRTAIQAIRAAVRQRPDDPAMRRSMAELYEYSGQLESALEAWQECARLVPNDEQPLRRAAVCAEQLGRSQKSIELLEQAQTVNPKSPGLRRRLASAYVAHGQVGRGIQTYSSALREAPNDASLAMEAAEAALLAGAAREALGFVGRAEQLAADEGRVQAALAEGYLLLNERGRAAKAIEKAVEHGESSGRVLAVLSIVRPDRAGAAQALSQAVPESAHDAIWIARAHRRLFEFEPAVQTLWRWNTEPAAIAELIRTELRMRDAGWLMQYADASLLSDTWPTEVKVDQLLEELQQYQPEQRLVDMLTAWAAAAEAPSGLAQFVEEDSSGELSEALTIAHLKQDALEQAVEAIALTKEINPEAEWLKLLEGISLELSGQHEQARSSFRKATDGGPLVPLAEYLIGRSYANSGSSERARTHIGKAVTEWMRQPAWQHRLGEIYLEAEQPDAALGHFQSATEADPANPIYQVDLAKTYQACGQLLQAENAFRLALQDEQPSPETFRLAGQVALQIDRPDEAATRFERACELAPDDALAHIGAANAAAALGKKQLAEKHLRAAIQLDPDRPEVLLGQGQVLMQTGKSAAAMEAFERALQVGADPAQVHRHQSKLLMKQGETQQALNALRQAVEAEPDDDATWHELAQALEAQSDLKGADEAIGQALRISPRNPVYRLKLAQISRRAGNLDRALEELRVARKTVPHDPRLAVETGLVHEDRREYSRALDAYREAIEIDPTCLQAYYRAGMLLRTLKAYRRAGEMLKQAAELAPINKDVMHQLAAVRALELVHG